MKTVYNNLYFFLMGLLVFSPLSSTIAIKYWEFPLSLPELFFIPFLFFNKQKIRSVKAKTSDVALVSIVVSLLVLVGLLYGEFPLFSMLSSARSWLYLFLCIRFFSRANLITNEDLLWLAFGSMVAWLADSLLNFQKLLFTAASHEFVATYGLMLSVPIFFSVALYRRNYKLLLLGLSVIVMTMLFAGIRRLMAVFVISLFAVFVLSLQRVKKNFSSYFILGSFLIVLFFAGMPVLRDYLYEKSPGMYYRIFTRNDEFLESRSLNSSDQVRSQHFTDLVNNFFDYTIPRGMVSVRTSEDSSTGIFNDFPLLQFFWIFGWPITICLLIYTTNLFLKNLSKYRINKDETSMLTVNCFIVMFTLLFLEGTFIEYPYATPITGLLFGRMLYNVRGKRLSRV